MPILAGPFGGRARTRAPPDALAQALRIRLEPQQARRVRKHRPRIGLRKTFAAQHLEKHLGVAPRHVGVGLAFRRRVAEIAPAVDHLLGRAAADAELQAAAADDVGRAGVLRHVQRVLVAHVDDRGADLDALGARADGGEQREGRAELAGIVMHAEERAVGAELLGGDRKLDRLQQRVGRRSHFRLRRGRPVAEREEADFFHVSVAHACCVRARYRVLATRARPSCVDAAGLWPKARNELLPKSDGSGAPGGAGHFRAAQSASPPLRFGRDIPPPHLSRGGGTCGGGAPPGAPPRRLLFARRRPCRRCRDRLAKRPSPRKGLGMWFRQGPLSIGKGRYRDGRTRARRGDHPAGAAGGCGVRLRARFNLAADIPDIAAGRR